MRIIYYLAFMLAFLLSLLSAKAQHKGNITSTRDYAVTLFDKEHVNFDPVSYKTVSTDSKGIVRLSNGRILLKKIQVPEFKKNVQTTVRIKLSSAGDRWDKSGSLFVLPRKSLINFINIAEGQKSFPQPEIGTESFYGIVPGEDYQPVLELMRFMTPFGVGAYSDSIRFRHRKPVYIPKWEKEVVWEQNISSLLPALEGEIWVGAWIDTWTKEGYNLSAELNFKESQLKCDIKKPSQVSTLVNTVYYLNPQKQVDLFARKDLEVSSVIPANAKNIRLKYIVTGHGGHDGGDEFVPQENIISVDGKVTYKFTPWRDDCASFRRFNPGSGVWLQKDTAQYIDEASGTYKEKVIEERIASSDYSRSNWCPGTDVTPVEIPLAGIRPGKHTFKFSIPHAQQIEGDKMNHWLISAYLLWDE
ncbi:MAG: PNGase F N-terminal domain-containing protein [Bacteroidota bacterium]|nr:PNGase F N-terminal domain-containing protein [Bacteroidota bacterium]